MKAILIPILLFAAAANAVASGWTKLATAQNGTVLMVDGESLISDGNYRSAWFKLIEPQVSDLPEGVTPNVSVPPGLKVAYSKSLASARCTKRRIGLLQAVYYGADDTVLGELPLQRVARVDFTEPLPNTVEDAELEYLCKAPLAR